MTDTVAFPVESTIESAPLVIIAKFASHAQNKVENPRDEATIKRFKLQTIAKSLLPTKRVSNCLRLMVPGAQDVEIYHVPDRDSAHFHNLRTCDSVWDCPVCAAKITERRRVEMMLGLAEAYQQGYTPILVTYTMRHHRGDKLADLLKALKAAHRAFKSGRDFQALKRDYGWVGSVTAAEITHGHQRKENHGWHPHLHELVFLEPMAANKLAKLESALKARWEHVLGRQGYDASWEHGLHVRDSDTAVIEYVAKWGCEPKDARWTVERELTKAPSKMASDDGVTPFQFLELYGAGDEEAGRLFQEYSKVFHGRAQLIWSRGLRALLGLTNEKTDEQLNAEEDESAELLCSLPRIMWYKLLRLPRDVRGELLVAARCGELAKVESFLSGVLSENVSLNSDGGEPADGGLGEDHSLDNFDTVPGSAGAGDTPQSPAPAGGLGKGSDKSTGEKINGDKAFETRHRSAGQLNGITFRGNVISFAEYCEHSNTARALTAQGWKRVERLGAAVGTVAAAESDASPGASGTNRGD